MLASTIHFSNTTPTNPTPPNTMRQAKGAQKTQPHTHHKQVPDQTEGGLIPQGPTVCQNQPPPPHPQVPLPPLPKGKQLVVLRRRGAGRRRSSMTPLANTTNASHTFGGCAGCVLLRKEVIQPHLPVRLPCYDFVPIASPTFDGSPHKGWATGFGCCRLS